MKFIMRALIGLVLLAATFAAAGLGMMRLTASFESGGPAQNRAPRERVFVVRAGELEAQTIAPVISTYGEISSWRRLELRSAVAGRLVDLPPAFRDGALVSEGQLIFRIDPTDYARDVENAETALAEAEAQLIEARESVGVAEREAAASDTQAALRTAVLERQRGLLARGVATAANVEDAELAAAAAEQAAAARAQGLISARAAIDAADFARRRAESGLAEARRRLEETEFRAPFRGLVTEANGVLGGLVSVNEKIGEVMDPTALEAAFRVTNAQFSRLLDGSGALKPAEVEVSLDLDGAPLTLSGVIDRAGAVVGDGQTGRLIYARLALGGATVLRPGDFVSIRITEPAMDNVAVIPSTAVTEEGEVLIIDGDERLRAVTVRIARRMGDDVLIADAPFGARYVRERAPQLGPGVKVSIANEDGLAPEPETVTLDAARQARLTAHFEANDRMPAGVRDRILATIATGEVPADKLAEWEARMGPAEPAAAAAAAADAVEETEGEVVSLTPERRERILTYLERDAGIPADRKTLMIARIRTGAAPRDMVEEIESQIGGG